MTCYCIKKTSHPCDEILDPFEKQYEDNLHKIKFDRRKIDTDPKQMIIASHIDEVKLSLRTPPLLNQEQIARNFSIISHYPQEFTEEEKKASYHLTLSMIQKSKKYFSKNGRLTFAFLLA